ncbi:PqqD family peptide modification chaperone [Streptomyces sp. NPDC052396]|uniref:PqqD family peptide modification chaperone n=1 Tax=Streptomyces sp. NPDC052396 TaxID=3365689 RepID=UPI0037D539C9
MWQLLDGAHPVLTNEGGAILSERTGRWTYLTPTASAAVLFLLAGNDEDQAAGQYAAAYGLPRHQAAADVRAVSDELATQGIAGTAVARRRRGWRR